MHVRANWDNLRDECERLLGYRFQSEEILLQALTHSSYSNENSLRDSSQPPLADNERLEFFGDAVIGLVVAKALMDRFPEASEGALSRWRSTLVSRATLAELSQELRLGRFLYLGRGEARTGGAEKRSILAGAFEAVIGAVYLDGGYEPVALFLQSVYQPWFDQLERGEDRKGKLLDRKTHLQERTQYHFKTTPVYRVVEAWGLEHEKSFRVEILISGKVVTTGDGKSKKEAEQMAADRALEILGF